MRRWESLNERQLDLLRRVGAGQDLGSPEHSGLRHSANAVRDRGLITITKRGGAWRAEITEAGKFYLEQGHHPDNPRYITEPVTTRPVERSGDSGNAARPQGAAKARPVTSTPHGLAEGIIRQLQAKGTVRIQDLDEQTRARYRRAIHAAKQDNLVPDGFHLRHTGRNSGDLIIQLSDDEHPDETEWNRIRLGVRDEVVETSALTKLLLDNPEVLDVSESVRPRALAFIESFAEAARRRGHKVAMSKKRKNRGLYILADGCQISFAIREEQQEVQREPVADSTHKAYSWQRRPLEYDVAPSGRLRLDLPESQNDGHHSWADDGRSGIEVKINQILKEVERRERPQRGR